MGQYEVSLFVGGGYHGSDYFDSAKDALAYIRALKAYDYSGETAEVFVLYHDHKFQDECSCIQYELDSAPFWTNRK